MKTLLKGTLVACALILPQIAQAALVTDWEYEISSMWTGATFDAGNGTPYQDATEISWGGTALYTDQSAGIGTARSALVLGPSPVIGTNLVTGSLIPALTNIITHWNNTLQGSFSTLIGAQLKTTLKLKPFLPVPGPIFLPTKILNFTINFTETPNNPDCGFPSDSICDDIFVISIGDLTSDFVYDGYKYTTNIVEVTSTLFALSPEACIAAGVAPGCTGFKTIENAATEAQFGVLIDADKIEVPEPVALTVFGLSLMGFALYGRRRSVQK